ncbi:MAG TPA: DUF1501 domain-containing protein [Pirellulales bacterium]|nr:DUF1501 domain-containing protein [Pirellulales bacterium]
MAPCAFGYARLNRPVERVKIAGRAKHARIQKFEVPHRGIQLNRTAAHSQHNERLGASNSPGVSRRDVLRFGGLAAIAAACPLAERKLSAEGAAAPRAPARSCILVYLLGGPPHQDMWDLKPEAPAEIRGPFKPVATNVPGLEICEHLPRLAQMADKYAVVRSVSHPNNNHTPMIYYTLTGRHVRTPEVDNDVSPPLRGDHPHLGSVAARFKPAPPRLPGFIALPEVAVRSSDDNVRAATPLRGGRAGFLGPQFDPFIINGDPRQPGAIPDVVLPGDVSPARFERRQALLAAFESPKPEVAGAAYGELRRMAVSMTGVAGEAELYDLRREPERVRQRYGPHRFGQSMLLSRRLAEAGVPMIAVHFNHMTKCDGWDTHAKNFDACRDELLPLVDQGISALLADLDERGLLTSTVVACFGEFGRTPKINAAAGRDHWGHCSSALLAGGGIRGGQVVGSSDKQAAFPRSDPFDPVDLHATMFAVLGLPPERLIYDALGRPMTLSAGSPIAALF